MSYYHICPYCGAHLDPSEQCDCMKEAVPAATNNENGKAENESQNPCSASILPKNKEDCQV